MQCARQHPYTHPATKPGFRAVARSVSRPRVRGGARPVSAPGRRGSGRAFTLVELLVVTAVIIIVLAIGIPSFTNLSREAAYSKSRQLTSGVLQRANLAAITERNPFAVRFVPAEWQVDAQNEASEIEGPLVGRQMAVTYRWSFTTQGNPTDLTQVLYAERFEPAPGTREVVLSPQIWAAPVESMLVPGAADNPGDIDGDRILTGRIGTFAPDATQPGTATWGQGEFLNADDFLIVFDESGAVRTSVPLENESGQLVAPSWAIKAYHPDPAYGYELTGINWSNSTETYGTQYRRRNFTGVVQYRRDVFTGRGVNADPEDRRFVLEQSGRQFFVSPSGGGLIGQYEEK